jgi:hypothetical protein
VAFHGFWPACREAAVNQVEEKMNAPAGDESGDGMNLCTGISGAMKSFTNGNTAARYLPYPSNERA